MPIAPPASKTRKSPARKSQPLGQRERFKRKVQESLGRLQKTPKRREWLKRAGDLLLSHMGLSASRGELAKPIVHQGAMLLGLRAGKKVPAERIGPVIREAVRQLSYLKREERKQISPFLNELNTAHDAVENREAVTLTTGLVRGMRRLNQRIAEQALDPQALNRYRTGLRQIAQTLRA